VKVENLRKIYGNRFQKDAKVAVQQVSFVVEKSECFALLGVNGAGKTSCFRILTGEYAQSQGEAYIAGWDVTKNMQQARHNIGYCPQYDALIEFLTPREHLELYANIKGVPKKLVNSFVN